MTDEQIKQNAEAYANKSSQYYLEVGCYEWICDAYKAGAHSLDEEIEELRSEMMKYRDNSVQIAAGEIGKLQEDAAFYKAQYESIKKELNQFRNPWISVEDSLPEKEKDCEDTSIMVAVICKSNPNRWYPAEYWFDVKRWFCCEQCVSTDYLDNVTHWMPIPQIKKEE